MLFLLLVGANRDERRTDHADCNAAGARGAGFGHFLVEDELLHHRETGAAVLLGPGGSDPAAVGQLFLPGTLRRRSVEHLRRTRFLAHFRAPRLEFVIDERAHFAAKFGFFVVVVEVNHRSSPS